MSNGRNVGKSVLWIAVAVFNMMATLYTLYLFGLWELASMRGMVRVRYMDPNILTVLFWALAVFAGSLSDRPLVKSSVRVAGFLGLVIMFRLLPWHW